METNTNLVPAATVTLDQNGHATFTYNPMASGFNSYAFFQAIEKLGGKVEDAKWYMCG